VPWYRRFLDFERRRGRQVRRIATAWAMAAEVLSPQSDLNANGMQMLAKEDAHLHEKFI
jgi:hypothetical protein